IFNFGSGSPAIDLIAGNYTLTVDASADHSGTYSFRLLDLVAAEAITQGTPLSGTLDPGSETDLYRFDATAGDQYYFDGRSVISGSVGARLLDPFGRQVWQTSLPGDAETTELGLSGTYTLLIEGAVSNSAPTTYTFNLQKVENTTAALVVGAQVDG